MTVLENIDNKVCHHTRAPVFICLQLILLYLEFFKTTLDLYIHTKIDHLLFGTRYDHFVKQRS